MACSILNVTFDCERPADVARFWSEVTGWPHSHVEMPGNPFWIVAPADDRGPRLVFVTVAEHKTSKNRVHLDLVPEDRSQAEEISRLLALGARIVDDRRDVEPGGWVVLADIEGNELCLEGGADA
jgi:predicted enzyme related to lactoylglutathione lyase